MIWTTGTVAQALGQAVPGRVDGPLTGISTDTRTLTPGALFLALTGEHFDGHDHLAAAAAAGALAAVVRQGTPPVAGLPLIEVDDTLAAYGRLARARRREVPGPVVAITGSNGKTSTKEMVAAVLGTRFVTHATRANLNNLVGIPQTILAAPEGTQALVIEAGANAVGEIPRARAIIEPTIVIVTTVSESHLAGFGSLEGILAEKLALVDGAEVVVTGTEPAVLADRARERATRVVTGGLAGADVMPERVEVDPLGCPAFTIDGLRIRLPLRGLHQAGNAMLAWAVVRELGLDRKAAGEALERLVLPGGRGELIQAGGLTILHDAYNANPQSFRAAIATARAMRGTRRLVFVAGSMRELGDASERLHREVAAELAAMEADTLGVVGDFVPAMAPYAARLGDRLITATDPVALGPMLAGRLQGDEIVVLKASRGMALESILPYLGVAPQAPH